MKPSLKDQLSQVKFSTKDYGNLPVHEKMFELQKKISPEQADKIVGQWEKLRLMRKNLFVLDKYVNYNRGETLSEWLSENQERVADKIAKELGEFNDKNKGISMYFLNLQKLYDDEETKFDDIEKNSLEKEVDKEYDKAYFEPLSTERSEKRKARVDGRNAKLKNFKKNNQGFLLIEEDAEDEDESVRQESEPKEEKKEEQKPEVKEPPIAENLKTINADASNIAPATPEIKKEEVVVDDSEKESAKDKALDKAVSEMRRTIAISLVGVVILVAVVVVATRSKKETN